MEEEKEIMNVVLIVSNDKEGGKEERKDEQKIRNSRKLRREGCDCNASDTKLLRI